MKYVERYPYTDQFRDEDWRLIRHTLTDWTFESLELGVVWAVKAEEADDIHPQFVDMLVDALCMIEAGIPLPEDPPL